MESAHLNYKPLTDFVIPLDFVCRELPYCHKQWWCALWRRRDREQVGADDKWTVHFSDGRQTWTRVHGSARTRPPCQYVVFIASTYSFSGQQCTVCCRHLLKIFFVTSSLSSKSLNYCHLSLCAVSLIVDNTCVKHILIMKLCNVYWFHSYVVWELASF